MALKILTVDDSKTVRIIVRKAFKSYDCEIIEATNGVEGLAAAAKSQPDLILLDVTMPVMDGIEMLTKLKTDPQLKGIPVVMLTAEGGRDTVLKIAKIGVRDYMVKPFKEEALVQKVARIVELKQNAVGAAKSRTILDEAQILIVDDKPAIVQQIQDGLKHTPWKINGIAMADEAIERSAQQPPDLILVSLALPDDAAYDLLRSVRANAATKATPVFGLSVKIETVEQQRAQQAGFTSVITKPVDVADLEMKMIKALNLDTSARYFGLEGDCLIIRLPAVSSSEILGEARKYLKSQLTAAVNAARAKVIIDILALQAFDIGVLKLLVDAMQFCGELGMRYALAGNAQVVAQCKGFEETKSWTFSATLAEAQAALASSGAAAPAPELAATG
jgi:two-component system cell cycle response regulator